MTDETFGKLDQLRHSITVLEGQRGALGDAVVEPALAALRQQVEALEAEAVIPHAPIEERRLITVFFTDIVGSTAIAERLDPEEWRKTVAAVHETVGTTIQEHQGSVVQYLGDGLLALFGARTASEHDPENAIRAALDAQNAVAAVPAPEPLRIRIGIHTGPVVVGVMGGAGRHEHLALGETPNVAARLQTLAPANTVVLSAVTARLVQGAFVLEDLGTHLLHGVGEPMMVSRVRGLLAPPSPDDDRGAWRPKWSTPTPRHTRCVGR
jgi:class 3 adenylate cyclase